jgi:tRNA (cytidine56-2'-O)-methyltransferase
MKITVLRLGHRRKRDPRLTPHVGLTARAFGAHEVILTGDEDQKVLETLNKVTKRWGGPFHARYERDWRRAVKSFKGIKIQLSMYGIPFGKKLSEIKKRASKQPIMIIVGGEKVPFELYDLVDYTLAVGNQPHSEVAALSILMYEIIGRKLPNKFKGAHLEIVPQERGKKVVEK